MRVKNEVTADHISLIAAGAAFYGLLSVFPAISAVLAIGGLLVEPDEIVDTLSQLAGLVPQDALDIITRQAQEVSGAENGRLGLAALFSLGLAIYSASRGVRGLITGLNVAYDEKEKRGYFLLTAVTLGMTVLLLIGLIIGVLVAIVLPSTLATINLGGVAEAGGTALAWVAMLVLTMIGLALLYRWGPSRTAARVEWVTPGAIVACALWMAGSAGFAFYVSTFGSYNESFGALAGVIVLLMWLWISAFIILLGAELNGEMEAQTRKDSTVGPEKPMGERGAVKADSLGEAVGSQ
ncbi:YihY/virulence factor BrkB family protein [Aliiruegeria haliotis]|uniref:YihY/virulence factor BrkB family protein n=1 Tax=Aliiruegeria haliotis TaxID=1280846 RepID=UPI00318329D6